MVRETEIGGGAASFPNTRRSIVERLGAREGGERREATGALIEVYWTPVHAYLRRRWGKSHEAAEDLTQAFFAAVIEKGFLADFDPSRARFRTYLRACVDRFAANAARSAAADKRGGDVEHVALGSEHGEPQAPDSHDTTEAWFEAEWRRALLGAALADLERECGACARPERFAIFRRYDVDDTAAARPTYAELAREHGIDESAVTNALAAARRDFRRLVLDRLRAWTRDEAEFQDELRALFGGSAGAK